MKRVGIYSGTFDPVHAGHLAFALAARRACGLEKVVFLPEERPRDKHGVTNISHRVALLETAVAGTPELSVMTLPHPTFTVRQVLPELQCLFAGAKLTLLVGSDVARFIMSWQDIELLLADVRIAVGLRAGDSDEELLAQFAGNTSAVSFVRTEFSGLASSQVRSGEAGHVTDAAAEYARVHSLYCH